ncbi:MAG: 5-oxoprolinase subunit PxpA, partial [Pseudomonadota bacterium]
MGLSVDLNADMGESFGPWVMGRDADIMDTISSANIACGFHAGDWDVMADTMKLAVEKGVGIGCHPGFPDLQGFGRRRMQVPHASLANLVRYQLGAAQAIAKTAGGTVRHLKLHGALGNMTSEDEALASAAYSAALDVDPSLVIVVMAGTAQQRAVEALGGSFAAEIFADRAYNEDLTLVDRRLPGAVIHDPEAAAASMVAMVTEGAVITGSGKRVENRIDTICCHGDTPEAVEMAPPEAVLAVGQ